MTKIIVKSPCVVKLFGEHAVVHGKTAVAVGISLYSTAIFKINESQILKIVLNDLKKEFLADKEVLKRTYEQYIKKESIDQYIKKNINIDKDVLPYLTIAAKGYIEFGCSEFGDLNIKSEVPKQSGLASSASCYTAFTLALLEASKKKLSDEECIELARDGERVSHRNENAGRIDVSTAYYGGYVSFSGKEFIKHELKAKPNLLIINTGNKLPTSETVGRVTKMLAEKKVYTENIFDKINECSINGLKYLYENDLEKVGVLMYENHELLKLLEVSSKKLDIAVGISKKYNAHGAKLSGGGGGGVAVALLRENNKLLENELISEGFVCINTKISEYGAKALINKE
ncbi:MAG: mevalonate kinase [Candidatus Micrarchaeaceae archaeon]